MSNALHASARAIAHALRPSERHVDTTILSQAELIKKIIEAGAEHDLPAEANHAAVRDAIRAMAALSDARDYGVSCHRHLAAARDAFGMEPEEIGCDFRKGGIRTADARLSVEG